MEKKNSLNILILIPNLDIGGAQVSFKKLCNQLSEIYNVIPCVYTLPQAENQFTQISKLNELTKQTSIKLIKFYRIYLSLKRLKRIHQIDVSISFMESANYLNVLTKSKEKVIISHRGSYLNDDEIKSKFSWLRLKLLMPWLFRKADISVSVSEALKDEQIKAFRLPPQKQQVIYNFYEIKSLIAKIEEPLPSELKFLNSKNYIVAVGRLHIQKGFKELIHVFKYVKLKSKCQLVIIGDGEMSNELIATCQSLKLSYSTMDSVNQYADVIFCGFIVNPLPIVTRANLFVLTSFWEGFPNALIEAMASGTLVLAADCPTGPREILDYKTKKPLDSSVKTQYGILLPMIRNEKNEVIWSETILSYLNNSDEKKKLIENSERRIEDFSKERAMKQWIHLINE